MDVGEDGEDSVLPGTRTFERQDKKYNPPHRFNAILMIRFLSNQIPQGNASRGGSVV
ncbi:hypothetical protein CIRG_09384 [Coccidioides immitis RMSCC 2394]|uniref:Uncharacterized protein n=1 Tax=Coccidioides immitis RMSCC 2394 TaxID=404692 RepID=A0A0J6YNB0_COCIT|nr:hypothetical protein CIRG_09384 [Coccidioides immitis RMSCC 2394]